MTSGRVTGETLTSRPRRPAIRSVRARMRSGVQLVTASVREPCSYCAHVRAGVVKGGRRPDDGLHEVVLQHIAADFALARTGASGEQRRAVQHDAEAAATVLGGPHLREEVHEEEERAVRDA